MAWGPGARRSNAPSGVQGAEPPEAPGFSGFLRPQNASPRIVFLSFFKASVSAKSFDIVRYKMILGLMVKLIHYVRKQASLLAYRGVDLALTSRNDLLARTGGV